MGVQKISANHSLGRLRVKTVNQISLLERLSERSCTVGLWYPCRRLRGIGWIASFQIKPSARI